MVSVDTCVIFFGPIFCLYTFHVNEKKDQTCLIFFQKPFPILV